MSTTVKRANVATLDIVHATVNAASKTTTPAIRTCFLGGGPGCNETSTVVAVLKGAAALPPFVV